MSCGQDVQVMLHDFEDIYEGHLCGACEQHIIDIAEEEYLRREEDLYTDDRYWDSVNEERFSQGLNTLDPL